MRDLYPSLRLYVCKKPHPARYDRQGKASLLVDLRTEKDTWAIVGGPYEFTGLLARLDIIERRPGMIQEVVTALVKANS